MARRIICVIGDVGDEMMLIPHRRRAMERVRATVRGEVELAREAADSD